MKPPESRQAVIDQALFLAVANADEHMVRKYLQEGANPNAVVDGGRSALHQALWLQMLDFAELMIAHGGDVNGRGVDAQSSPAWMTAIMRDAQKLTTKRTEFCIRHGADFSMRFEFASEMVGVHKALDIYSSILVERERTTLGEIRRLIDNRLAVATRQRQEKLARQRASKDSKYRL